MKDLPDGLPDIRIRKIRFWQRKRFWAFGFSVLAFPYVWTQRVEFERTLRARVIPRAMEAFSRARRGVGAVYRETFPAPLPTTPLPVQPSADALPAPGLAPGVRPPVLDSVPARKGTGPGGRKGRLYKAYKSASSKPLPKDGEVRAWGTERWPGIREPSTEPLLMDTSLGTGLLICFALAFYSGGLAYVLLGLRKD